MLSATSQEAISYVVGTDAPLVRPDGHDGVVVVFSSRRALGIDGSFFFHLPGTFNVSMDKSCLFEFERFRNRDVVFVGIPDWVMDLASKSVLASRMELAEVQNTEASRMH